MSDGQERQTTDTEARGGRQRRALPLVLVVVASIVFLFAVFAIWAKRQLLETDTWVDTSSELLENETISNAVADYSVDELFANVDVQAELEKRLPPPVDRLAPPIAGGLQQLAHEAAREALQRPSVQSAWQDVNRAAHETFLKVIDDEGEFVSTGSGVVTLDLHGIVTQIALQTGLPDDIADKLPPEAAQLEVLRADELEAAQEGVSLMRTLFWVLSALTLLLYGLAIYLARGRRRETLRAVGFAFIAVGAVVLFARSLAGDAVTSSLAATTAAEPPVEATWEIGTSLLKEGGHAIIGYGIVIVAAAWLAGPTGIATPIRRAITPYFRRPGVAYSALGVLLILIFWWDPTAATSRLVPSLILIALLALGFEMLRRQVIREFPDHVTPLSAEGIAQQLAARMREARERRITMRAAAPPTSSEQRLSQLERLGELRKSGTLSDDEFEREKQRVLAG